MVPFPPGGATDVIARNLAERMKVSLGQPVIIENVTGAGGTIGTGRVARAAPDGYTLSIGQTDTHVITGATYALQYDVLNGFEPVAPLSTTPMLLLARKTLPADHLKGLIGWLKSNPDKASMGIVTAGLTHIAGVLFQIYAKLTLRRSFGIIAANRGVTTAGPYRLIRHPMYAAYMISWMGFFLASPTPWNAAVYGFAFVCQIARLTAEERLLNEDAAYRNFVAAVPYRLLPGVF